jgi:hypothetical protein
MFDTYEAHNLIILIIHVCSMTFPMDFGFF